MKKIITIVLLTTCMLALLVGCSQKIPEKPIEEAEAVTDDIAPFVYVNDTLYKQSGDQKSYAEKNDEFTYLGKIESVSDGEPKQNFQSNDNILGCEVYQYGENVVVLINNRYWLYTKYGEQEINPDDISEEEKMEQDPAYKPESQDNDFSDNHMKTYTCNLYDNGHADFIFSYENNILSKVEYVAYIKGTPDEEEARLDIASYSGVKMLDKADYILFEIDMSQDGLQYLQENFTMFNDLKDCTWASIQTVMQNAGYTCTESDVKSGYSPNNIETISFSGTITDNMIESLVPLIVVKSDAGSDCPYDTVLFELTEEQKEWELMTGARVKIVCTTTFAESMPPIGDLISIEIEE